MELPGSGGGDYQPIRLTGDPYCPVKRRAADTIDYYDYYHSRHKRQKHAQSSQFVDHVAYKAVDDALSHIPLYHPDRQPRYPSPHSHLPSPVSTGAAPPMERTASGHSIRADPTERCGSTELLEDDEAAQRVKDHLAAFRRRNPDSKHERILRSIINPRRRHQDDEYPLDNDALESIFSAANEIFFNGRLSQRVAWDWSHASAARYDSRVVGTTALRRAAAATRGFETLIVLSSPILRDDARFSRRLLISTFLHELIHSYLFICCGFRARWCGGHTPGFRAIAEVIDEWAGKESGLYLSRVEADLELFRVGGPAREEESGQGGWGGGGGGVAQGRHPPMKGSVYPCSGMAVEHEYAADLAGSGCRDVAQFCGCGIGPAAGAGVGGGRQEVVPGHSYNEHRGSSSSNSWWRQHRTVRPTYVYAGDEPTASYVYPNTMLEGP
ncbi:hypothetical protein VTK56DRAFT_880 [Thermocarpiscus australiensis]